MAPRSDSTVKSDHVRSNFCRSVAAKIGSPLESDLSMNFLQHQKKAQQICLKDFLEIIDRSDSTYKPILAVTDPILRTSLTRVLQRLNSNGVHSVE